MSGRTLSLVGSIAVVAALFMSGLCLSVPDSARAEDCLTAPDSVCTAGQPLVLPHRSGKSAKVLALPRSERPGARRDRG